MDNRILALIFLLCCVMLCAYPFVRHHFEKPHQEIRIENKL